MQFNIVSKFAHCKFINLGVPFDESMRTGIGVHIVGVVYKRSDGSSMWRHCILLNAPGTLLAMRKCAYHGQEGVADQYAARYVLLLYYGPNAAAALKQKGLDK